MPGLSALVNAVATALVLVGSFAPLPAHAAAEPAAPLQWLDPEGRPGPGAQQALALLASAPEDGLDPARYALPPLEAPSWAPALTAALLRYANDLHDGRLRTVPRRASAATTGAPFDAAAWLQDAMRQGDLRAAAAALPPAIGQYGLLKQALAQYRHLAAQPPEALPPAPSRLLPGDRWAGCPALRQWLQAWGDLSAAEPAPADPERYDRVLVSAVQAFQRRHGLVSDGVIGRATQAALRVPPGDRVQQIELSMERLRALPHDDAPRGLSINIPTFRLVAWEGVGAAARPGPAMDVIVGSALDTRRTPLLYEPLRRVVFRPYWNVPRSILVREILPKWANDPGYLEREQLDIVQGPGDDAKVLGTGTEHRAGLVSGALRLRQRPGLKNALGLVKFIFPNDASVYLHGTPQTELFQRTRRDLSHGCVRVADPAALAEWVLRDLPGWDRARIEAAMQHGPDNQRLELPRPLPVLMVYLTAVVSPSDGRLHFAPDLYGHDQQLRKALQRAAAAGYQ